MSSILRSVRAFARFSLFLIILSPFAASAAERLDINRASADQIAAVMTGVGEKKAQAIIEYRTQHGPFKSVDQLVEVKGLGTTLVDRNRALIQVVEEKTDSTTKS